MESNRKRKNHFLSSAIWKQGNRPVNEDTYCIWHMKMGRRQYLLAIVCDGIGGLAEGEKASSYLMLTLREKVKQLLLQNPRKMNSIRLRTELSRELFRIHESLKKYGQEQRVGIGTTFSMLLICNQHYLICNVGDSRIYTGRHRLRQRTRDDRNRENALIKSIGHGSFPYPVISSHRIYPSQTFLLCTDGFYHKNISTLQHSLTNHLTTDLDLHTFLTHLYQNAVLHGETDNATAVLIRKI